MLVLWQQLSLYLQLLHPIQTSQLLITAGRLTVIQWRLVSVKHKFDERSLCQLSGRVRLTQTELQLTLGISGRYLSLLLK